MALLSNKEIKFALSELKGWSFSDNKIHKNFSFKTYMDGIIFVNNLAKIAEEKKREFNLIYKGKIATNISKLKNYCKAEEFHQKYIEKNK